MSKVPKFVKPTRMPLHHVPNVLPVSHKREDYDFDYEDGTWGPIRVSAQNVPFIHLDTPPLVWCRRHGWEREIIPDSAVYSTPTDDGGKVWGWRCPTCRKYRTERNWLREFHAIRSFEKHMADKHGGVVPFRLHAELPEPGAQHPAEAGVR